MRSTFYGLEINRTGLFVSQKNIDVTGHNISNMGTPGYTRQRIIQASIDPARGPIKFLPRERGIVGGGVEVVSLDQIRSVYLDRSYRTENTLMGEWESRSDAMYFLEDLFGDIFDSEGDTSSIASSIDTLFQSFHDLTKNPESAEIRTIIRQEASKLAETLNSFSTQLSMLEKAQDDEIVIQAGQINDSLSAIAALNEQIFKFELSGNKANDLRDKRNLLIDELSNIVPVTYSESEEGYFTLNVGEQEVVHHKSFNYLVIDMDRDSYEGEMIFHSLSWEAGEGTVAIPDSTYLTADDLESGRLKGLLYMRDGNDEEQMGVPYFLQKLDEFTEGLVTAINSVHYGPDAWGYPDPKTGSTSNNYTYFFDPNGIKAKDIRLDDDIIDSIYNIAASSVMVEIGGETGNNINALLLAGLQTDTEIPIIGNFKDYLKEIIATIATETSHANRMLGTQDTLVASIENQRQEISGVSENEELINLIRFEKAYNASARMITSYDECLDTLINRTGIVGR